MAAEVVGTHNGFTFGAMTVEASAELPQGHTVVTVRAGGHTLEVYCSPTGRSLRVFRKGYGEMKVCREP